MTLDQRMRQVVDWLRVVAGLLLVIICIELARWVASGH